MSLCPYCQSKDKEFFAAKCHNCNTEVTMGEQITGSVVYTLCQVGVIVGVIFLLVLLF